MQTQLNSPFAAVVGLGSLKAEYGNNKARRTFGLGCGLFFLIPATLLFLLLTLSLGVSGGEVPAFLIFAALFAISLGLGSWIVFYHWRRWLVAARLYENGFAYYDRNGLQQLRWDQIEAVSQSLTRHHAYGIHTTTTHVYTVQANNGAKIVLDNGLRDVEQLGQAIQAGSAAALFPRYVQALQAGQRVTFGPLALDAQGLHRGNKALRWDEIKAVSIRGGEIWVTKEGGGSFGWTNVTVPEIPNFYAFCELMRRLTRVE